MAKIIAVLLFFFSTCMVITIIFKNHNADMILNPGDISMQNNKEKSCDLSEGEWIRDPTGPLYTNYSCKTLPLSKNCLLNGRKDQDFLYWRWKPNQCELPRFEPQTFLTILRGKNMAFIGDSLARNHMESLLCLLSTVETPKLIEKYADDKFTTWEFPKHNFKVMALWSPFLVAATSIVVNGTDTGSYHLHIDRVDPSWSEKLPSLDYAVFSTGQWFLRQNNLYEGGNLIGCTICNAPNVTSFDPGFTVRKAIRAAFDAVSCSKKKKKMSSFLRTFSPTHFENGEWNTGGRCNRTRPAERNKVPVNWDLRRDQMEEVEMLKKNDDYEFEVVDVTEMMLVRVDGHPDLHWKNMWMKGRYVIDCLHWCLPGPIDTWNQLLLEMIKRKK